MAKHYPIIFQQRPTTCGLAAMAMIFHAHDASIGKFLKRLHDLRWRKAGVAASGREYNRRVEAAEALLLLKLAKPAPDLVTGIATTRGGRTTQRMMLELPDVLATVWHVNKVKQPLDKYMKAGGMITKRVFDAYIDTYKTQTELLFLARIFGFTRVSFKDPGGMNNLGAMGCTGDVANDARRLALLRSWCKDPAKSVLVGIGQMHWVIAVAVEGKKIVVHDPGAGLVTLPFPCNPGTLFYPLAFRKETCRENIAILRKHLA